MKNSDQWAAVDSKMTPAQDSVSHRGRFNKPFLYTEPFLIFYISTATPKASNTITLSIICYLLLSLSSMIHQLFYHYLNMSCG